MSDKITMTLDEFRMAIRAENVRAAIKMREACQRVAFQRACAGGKPRDVFDAIAAITVDEVLK